MTTSSFTELAAYDNDSFALTGSGAAEQIPTGEVTGGFFAVMGTPPLLGRAITTDDDPMGARDVVVLSHALWVRRFGANPAIVGQQLMHRRRLARSDRRDAGRVSSTRCDPKCGCRCGSRAKDLETQRGAHYIDVIGRLKPDVTLDRAREDMRAIGAQAGARFSAHQSRDHRCRCIRCASRWSATSASRCSCCSARSAWCCVIVCVNVAGLVLIRAIGRGRELAVRVAMGAGRTTLVRSLLIESLVLGLAGGAAGLVLAYWATTAIAVARSVDRRAAAQSNAARHASWSASRSRSRVLASVIFGTHAGVAGERASAMS